MPEVIAERPLSNLHGLGGAIQNFELQKGGSETPQIYQARLVPPADDRARGRAA